MTDTILDAKQMAEIAQKYVDIICSHDLEAMCDLFAPDAIQEDPVGGEIRAGIDAIREFYTGVLSHNIKAELIGSARCAGNSLAFPMTVTVGEEDSQVRLETINVYEFSKDGKFQSMKAYWGVDNCSSV